MTSQDGAVAEPRKVARKESGQHTKGSAMAEFKFETVDEMPAIERKGRTADPAIVKVAEAVKGTPKALKLTGQHENEADARSFVQKVRNVAEKMEPPVYISSRVIVEQKNGKDVITVWLQRKASMTAKAGSERAAS